ncbi:HEAT repeat domain-containing protein [Nostoc sp. UHCC 0870]|uniref:HEAT repeat domain-containing protein n=1 Tax=Nostoc sp. UHCC 0870 TaxID=2914041 RepID=UPI001EDF4478|nr:HEAT repeat domain-containing protein [Nostoc sp. UHCC 0870]UKO99687.1 HEAT repeat domain-containing protein [Nostoc sp. UHCC 0870]
MINWNDYLQSLCKDYAQKCKYTLTDVVGQQRVEQKHSPLLLDFMVQTVQSGKEERSADQQVERLDVLAGLRKYAKEHVLLVGRPGSGKSTALLRLLLEEAEKPLPQPLPEAERGANSPPSLPKVDRGVNSPPSLAGKGVGGLGQIPILVELRYYQTSVLDLIRDFLKRHRLLLDTATIEQLLCQGQFLLLVDGINELPSEKARQDLSKFRQDNQKSTPMIFTTRDLGVGGDLGITKKLEMRPLTAEQMQQFVRAYLPEQGEQMLQNLGDRLREFGETPLLLWMLCSLFQSTGDIPQNLGLVFRQFTQSYERKFRQDIPVTDESRRWWFSLLKHLAFYMTKGDKLTELNVAIPRLKAEEVLTQFLQAEKFDKPRDRGLNWLQDLLNHHLIQLGANDQIEFRHQLIQEYYTAECLLKQLPSLSDDCLQREYLNYLKWTEPFKLMLKLVDDAAQAIRVVKLALEVDWQLGAKLAGAVKPDFQQQTVDLVASLEVSFLFKVRLLGLTKSEQAISYLNQLLENADSDVRSSVAEALGEIKSEAVIPGLIELLKDDDSDVRSSVVISLEKIKLKAAIPELINLLRHEDFDVSLDAAEALGAMKFKEAIPELINLIQDENYLVRVSAAKAKAQIELPLVIPRYINFNQYDYKLSEVVSWVTSVLKNIKFHEVEYEVITSLQKILKYEYSVLGNYGYILNHAIKALEAIQKECNYYNYRLTQPIAESKSQPDISQSNPIKPSLMHILHLSDLHFGTSDQAKLWSNQLASDLQNELNILQLDALILSGDIANKSTPDEYAAAQQFLNELRQDFALQPEQIIIVPGNHDLNWQISEEEGYIPTLRRKYQGSINESCVIDDGGAYIAVVDPENHKRRFEHFSNFYQTIKNQPYPLDYDQQYTLDHFPNQKLLILGLNSAWQLDHHYKSHASININALTKALTEIRRNQDYQNCIKIAVWHHPLNSASEDRITDHGFMEQLAQANFRFALHGHIHKAETSLYKYDMSASGRKLDIISAGTFGAPVWEWVSGYPLQYNLLKFADNKLTVYTRRREELNGVWKPDARWLMGAGQNPLPYYEVQL